MAFKMCEEAQTLTVYNLRTDTQEFIGAGDAYIPPHTGLPANCTIIVPPAIPVDEYGDIQHSKRDLDAY